MSQNKKPVALAIGATLAGGLMLSGSAFASTQLAQGYLLGAQEAGAAADKAKEGSCGADKKAGEGKCGVAAMDSDKDGKVSRSEFTAAHADEAGEFDTIDANKDGSIDADEGKAHMEGKCGGDKKSHDGAKSGDKADMEGKCGEGKCGGSI
jgi:uncharacterized low-complexity protein